MKLASGHEVEAIEEEELAKMKKDYDGMICDVRLVPGPWVFPKLFLQFADKYYKFQFRSSDVVIATYPKSGTTWMQEIVWTMRSNPDLTNPDAALPLIDRTSFLEWAVFFGDAPDSNHPFIDSFGRMCPGRDSYDGVRVQMAEIAPDPRIIKTHLPLSLLPPELLDICKVVYVARNPKDVMVSYYHHCRFLAMNGYKGTWEDFIDSFLKNNVMYGSYAQNLKEAWEERNHPNMHIVFYENLKADMVGELKRLDAFLGTNLPLQQLEAMAQHTSFKEMKNRSKSIISQALSPHFMNQEVLKKDGGFFRSGKVGDWQNKFSPEISAKVDSWIEENIKSIGVDFKYST